MDELTKIKTVVSEAVTNAIIHGYNNDPDQLVSISCAINDGEIELTIKDNGIGIGDVEEARQPLYTSKPELERSGMGFTIIENLDRKSTRLNSSHVAISYAVFCLKKKNNNNRKST